MTARTYLATLPSSYTIPTASQDELIQDVVRDRGYVVDMDGFDKCMAEQKARAKSASTFGIDYNKELKITENTVFTGYDSLSSEGKITHIFKDGAEVDSIATDENAVIVLDKTPFYGEMGGQVGDKGVITIGENARLSLKIPSMLQKLQSM